MPKATDRPYEVSPRVEMQATTQPYAHRAGAARTRPLRIFTLDPSVSQRSGGIATVEVPYEDLEVGPAGRLFEIDPKGALPVESRSADLDNKDLLLQDGLAPSPATGQFHLQMVYAVCNVIRALWRPRP